MISLLEAFSLVLVGALWGCTNPLLRMGSTNIVVPEQQPTSTSKPSNATGSKRSFQDLVLLALGKFRRVTVWMPYLLNQTGSLVYYFTLAKSDLSLAVPICNGLALVFSMATSYILGERVDKPIRMIAGAVLVMAGVCLCLFSDDNNTSLPKDVSVQSASSPPTSLKVEL